MHLSEKSGIIREGRLREPTKITDDAIDNIPLVEIDGLTQSENEFVRNQHQELLRYARDNNDSNEVAFVFRKGFTDRSEFLGSDDKIDFGAALYGKGDGIFIMHNHPRNSSFSFYDILEFLKDDVSALSIVKNNGEVEVIKKTGSFDKRRAMVEYARIKKAYIKNGADEEYSQLGLAFLQKLSKGGNIQWSK